MGEYTVVGWYPANGKKINVSDTIEADSDAAAHKAAEEMFDRLGGGSGYGFLLRDSQGRLVAW